MDPISGLTFVARNHGDQAAMTFKLKHDGVALQARAFAMSTETIFGGIVAHSFGLTNVPLLIARPLRETRLAVSWLSCGAAQMGPPRTVSPEDSFVVMLHLADYKHHELWQRGGRPIRVSHYPRDAISIVHLMQQLSVKVSSALEALSFYIPRPTLDAFTDEAAGPRVVDLSCEPASIDPILANLGAALLPAFARPWEANTLFVDQVSLALQAHVAVTYGGFQLALRKTGGLSRWQEKRAKDYLIGGAPGNVSIAGVAAACNLSRSYFIKAFKNTTGRTPHRWLLEQRVYRAKELLLRSRPIVDIALECGFADQSHFTRVFTNIVGAPPATWRRDCKS